MGDIPLPTYSNTKNKLRAIRRRIETVKNRLLEEPNNSYLVAEHAALNAAIEAILYVRDVREQMVRPIERPRCKKTISISGHGEIICALPTGHKDRCMSSEERCMLSAEYDPHRKR